MLRRLFTQTIIPVGIAALSLAGCGTIFPPTSDVPCLQPADWHEFIPPLVRAEAAGSDVLLITGQTDEQAATNSDDGLPDFSPHVPVYRLDPAVGSFEPVSDAAWDNADTRVIVCVESGPASPLVAVPVAGGIMLKAITSPTRPVAAVLSSAGLRPGFPFIRPDIGTGQHYHQLFSEVDRSPIGNAVRLGVGNEIVHCCWTAQENYVIYWQFDGVVDSGQTTLCAVPTTADLMSLEGE